MKLKLNLSQRWGLIILLSNLKQGNFKEMRLCKKSLETIRISESEREEYGIIVNGNSVIWDLEKGKIIKEFNLEEELIPFVKLKLQTLSDSNLLTSEMIDIAEKIGVE